MYRPTLYLARSVIVLDGLVWNMSPGACEVDPPASKSGPWSKTTTSRQPSRLKCSATLQPTMPAPTITTRALPSIHHSRTLQAGREREDFDPAAQRSPYGHLRGLLRMVKSFPLCGTTNTGRYGSQEAERSSGCGRWLGRGHGFAEAAR